MDICEFIDDYAEITKYGSHSGPGLPRLFTFRFVRRADTDACREGMDNLHRWFMSRLGQKIKLQNSFEAKKFLDGNDGDGFMDVIYTVEGIEDTVMETTRYVDRQPANLFPVEFTLKVTF